MKPKYPFHDLRTTDVAKYYRLVRASNPEAARAKQRKYTQNGGFARWRLKNKLKHIQALGGKCQKCGYNKCVAALDLHEINGKQRKNSAFCYLSNVDYSNIILLCANCHRELHYEEKRRLKENAI